MPFDNLPQTKADPFELDTFIAWAERQPADREYDWAYPDECLCGQYMLAHGMRRERSGIWPGDRWLFEKAHARIFALPPYTTGAALHRAYALREARGKSDG